MKKIVIAISLCALMVTGLLSFNEPSPRSYAASIDRAETQRLLALEKPTVKIKQKYKKNEQLAPKELKAILYEAGFRGKNLKEAWAVAMKESTGRPSAHNDNPATGDSSYGLFQINMIGSLGPSRRDKFSLDSNKDLFNPVRNAEIAFFMSDGGKNWSAWNGITNKTISWMSEFPSKP